MSTATPAVLDDLIAKITALRGADFPAASIGKNTEDPPGGAVTEAYTWVKFVSEMREDYDFDGAIRYQTFRVKRRADLTADPKAAAALTAMVTLADALDNIGAFTGASGADYMEILVTAWPAIREEQYVLMDVQVSFDTPSTV